LFPQQLKSRDVNKTQGSFLLFSGGSALQVIGKVKWFNTKKGFGFIRKEDSEQDIFVHYTSIEGDGYKALQEGEEVRFELVEGPKGLQAQNVSRLA